jgi:phage regulator Rha-like protein
MTSREIAELTGKTHSHVCRDIRTMLDELGEHESNFGSMYTVAVGNGALRAATEYRLPKRETLILVSGYSVTMRALRASSAVQK